MTSPIPTPPWYPDRTTSTCGKTPRSSTPVRTSATSDGAMSGPRQAPYPCGWRSSRCRRGRPRPRCAAAGRRPRSCRRGRARRRTGWRAPSRAGRYAPLRSRAAPLPQEVLWKKSCGSSVGPWTTPPPTTSPPPDPPSSSPTPRPCACSRTRRGCACSASCACRGRAASGCSAAPWTRPRARSATTCRASPRSAWWPRRPTTHRTAGNAGGARSTPSPARPPPPTRATPSARRPRPRCARASSGPRHAHEAYLDAEHDLPPEWAEAASTGDLYLDLTADELAEMAAEVRQVFGRWLERSDRDRAGTRPVLALHALFPRP